MRWIRMVALSAALGMGLFGASTVLSGAPASAQRRGAATAATATTGASGVAATSTDGVVNLNTATEEELTRLPGIGASKARAILAFRERVRRFQQPEDLMRVRGIGRATFRRLRPMLRIDGQTTLTGAATSQH